MSLPLIIESIVAVLLFVTAGYCVVLERRMRAFRTDQQSLRLLIEELDRATLRAETAVSGLGETTRATEQALDERIREARTLTRSLALLAAKPGKPNGHAGPKVRAHKGDAIAAPTGNPARG